MSPTPVIPDGLRRLIRWASVLAPGLAVLAPLWLLARGGLGDLAEPSWGLVAALLAVLGSIGETRPLGFELRDLPTTVTRHAELVTLNTRGAETGVLRAAGQLRFHD